MRYSASLFNTASLKCGEHVTLRQISVSPALFKCSVATHGSWLPHWTAQDLSSCVKAGAVHQDDEESCEVKGEGVCVSCKFRVPRTYRGGWQAESWVYKPVTQGSAEVVGTRGRETGHGAGGTDERAGPGSGTFRAYSRASHAWRYRLLG